MQSASPQTAKVEGVRAKIWVDNLENTVRRSRGAIGRYPGGPGGAPGPGGRPRAPTAMSHVDGRRLRRRFPGRDGKGAKEKIKETRERGVARNENDRLITRSVALLIIAPHIAPLQPRLARAEYGRRGAVQHQIKVTQIGPCHAHPYLCGRARWLSRRREQCTPSEARQLPVAG